MKKLLAIGIIVSISILFTTSVFAHHKYECKENCQITPTVCDCVSPTPEVTITPTEEPVATPTATIDVPHDSDRQSDNQSDHKSDGGRSSDFENKSGQPLLPPSQSSK